MTMPDRWVCGLHGTTYSTILIGSSLPPQIKFLGRGLGSLNIMIGLWLEHAVGGKAPIGFCLITVVSQLHLWPTVTERKLSLAFGATFTEMTILGF